MRFMKIIYRGGYEKSNKRSVGASYFYEYSDWLNKLMDNGKKIAFVTLAKDDGYYDPRIRKVYRDRPDIIGYKTKIVDWLSYDVIIICGGDTIRLKKAILDKRFKINSLKKNVVIIGDSAGAYLMSAYFYNTDDGEFLTFHKGLYPGSNLITIAHINNSRFINKGLIKKVEKFARKKNLKALKLKENQAKILENNQISSFSKIN